MIITNKKIIAAAGLIALAALGWYAWHRTHVQSTFQYPSISSAGSSVPPPNVAAQLTGQVMAAGNGSITIAPFVVPTAPAPAAPGVTAPATTSGSGTVAPGPALTRVPGVPLPVSSAAKKTYTVASSTTITTQVPRDQKTFEAELAAYRQARAANPKTTAPVPRAYTDKILTLRDIKPGMLATVIPVTAGSSVAQSILVILPPAAK